jgi:hypothetical protein
MTFECLGWPLMDSECLGWPLMDSECLGWPLMDSECLRALLTAECSPTDRLNAPSLIGHLPYWEDSRRQLPTDARLRIGYLRH